MVYHAVRRANPADIPRLNGIDMSYTAEFGYEYRRTADGDGYSFNLVETTFDSPFERTYEWDWTEVDDFAARVTAGDVWCVYPTDAPSRPVGLIEIRRSEWNNAAWIQSLYVDSAHRGRGLGTLLLRTTLKAIEAGDVRAVFVETQVSNGPAIRFYRSRGFEMCGLNDHLYTNDDAAYSEVALFMVRRL